MKKSRHTESEPPDDVKNAFNAYAGGGGGSHMTLEEFRRFLAEQQGDPLVSSSSSSSSEDVSVVANNDNSGGGGGGDGLRQQQRQNYLDKLSQQQPLLGLDDFLFLLLSDDYNPPIPSKVHQPMTAPLSHYFIFTGHNSYLTGNQLSSDCSDIPIKEALLRGVRVIELDMWPNSKRNDVDILHGRTLTAPVKLIKCLVTIKEFAFCTSPYPVIITLEDHLPPELQAKVAEMVIEVFGDMLYYPKEDALVEFPCPEDLKERIILSTKPPKEYLDSQKVSKFKRGESQREVSTEEETWGKEVIELGSLLEFDKIGLHHSEEDATGDEDDCSIPQNSALEYRHLITIRAGKPKGRLKHALRVEPDEVRRISLSEQEMVKAANELGEDVIRFTQKNLLRIYPKGTRFNSSNYNPLVAWMHGAQMIAFNMQGYGRSLWLMQGFFRANGGCGYVKKPDFLLNVGPYGDVFDPKANLPVEKTFKVKIYMGDGWRVDYSTSNFDSFSPPGFFVNVGIAGAPADCTMKKTKTVENHWTPVWDEEFTFPLTVPELALLRIEVHESDRSRDGFGGQTCLPVTELRPGIRAVPLYDRKGMKFKSVRLLMNFSYL